MAKIGKIREGSYLEYIEYGHKVTMLKEDYENLKKQLAEKEAECERYKGFMKRVRNVHSWICQDDSQCDCNDGHCFCAEKIAEKFLKAEER